MAFVPPKRRQALGRWLHAYDPSITIPGSGTTDTCAIHVPFRHRFIAASASYSNVDIGSSIVSGVVRQAEGGATHTAVTDTPAGVAIADLNTVITFAIVDAAKGDYAAGHMYHLRMIGLDAGDNLEQATLAILVTPIPGRRAL